MCYCWFDGRYRYWCFFTCSQKANTYSGQKMSKAYTFAIFLDTIKFIGEPWTLHDGTVSWALYVPTTISDLDHISRSQQCQIDLTNKQKHCYIWFSSDFVWLLIVLSKLWLCLYFSLWRVFNGDSEGAFCLDKTFKVGCFLDTVHAQSFKLCKIITYLACCLYIHIRFGDSVSETNCK